MSVVQLEIKAQKRLNMNAFSFGQDKIMCKFWAYIAFNKATNGQTDIYIKHARDENLAQCNVSCIVILLGSYTSEWKLRVILWMAVIGDFFGVLS